MNGDSRPPHIDAESLPDISQPQVDYHDTSFFLHDINRKLPSPEHAVEKASGARYGTVKFEYAGLIVKFSPELNFEEAQTMRALRSAFPNNTVPVPEVFGWRSYRHWRPIYMSLVEGITLYDAWPSLTDTDKGSVCLELRDVIASLQQITREPTEALISSINGGRLQDRFFQLDGAGGPFSSIQSFNNFFFAVATRQPPQLEGCIDGPYREYLADEGHVFFTHGDLTPTNVLVSGKPGCYRITGIIDWEQAGWYPEY